MSVCVCVCGQQPIYYYDVRRTRNSYCYYILNNEWFIVLTIFRDSSIRIYINCSIMIMVDHNKFIAHEEIQYDSVIVVLITL